MSQLLTNAKEGVALVAISAGIGYIVKKGLRKAVTSDHSASFVVL